jgi:hypothetical protein
VLKRSLVAQTGPAPKIADVSRAPVATEGWSSPDGARLDIHGSNEHYLFHGTKPVPYLTIVFGLFVISPLRHGCSRYGMAAPPPAIWRSSHNGMALVWGERRARPNHSEAMS